MNEWAIIVYNMILKRITSYFILCNQVKCCDINGVTSTFVDGLVVMESAFI